MGKSKLTKSDLVDIISSSDDITALQLSKHQIATVVSTFIETLRKEIEKLDDNERIELRGFGTFGVSS